VIATVWLSLTIVLIERKVFVVRWSRSLQGPAWHAADYCSSIRRVAPSILATSTAIPDGQRDSIDNDRIDGRYYIRRLTLVPRLLCHPLILALMC